MDFKGYNQTFGPIFHPDEFLLPLLDLQEQVKGLVANITVGDKKEYVMLKDICNNPLSRPDKEPNVDNCNIQSMWAYWQDNVTLFETTFETEDFGNITYLDHFLQCTR